jgi:hypothetical protein
MMIPQSTEPKKPTLIPKFRNVKSNKITIAPESLKSIAQWDRDGWQLVVDSLVNSGFEVFNVSYEDTLKLNNVKGYHGFDDINVSLNHILESRLFKSATTSLYVVCIPLNRQPMPLKVLGCASSCITSAKWIKHKVSLIG